MTSVECHTLLTQSRWDQNSGEGIESGTLREDRSRATFQREEQGGMMGMDSIPSLILREGAAR
jgi:hypothetical protein